MDCKSVDEIANTIEISLERWKESIREDERRAIERAIGEELFHTIFQSDTSILGPWHLRASGKQKIDRYCEFKNRWSSLCSRKPLQAHSKDLNIWCRSAAIVRMISGHGIDPEIVPWDDLKQLQLTRSSRRIYEECKAYMDTKQSGEAFSSTNQVPAPAGESVSFDASCGAEAVCELSIEPSAEETEIGREHEPPETPDTIEPRMDLDPQPPSGDTRRSLDEPSTDRAADRSGSELHHVDPVLAQFLESPMTPEDDPEALDALTDPSRFRSLRRNDRERLIELVRQARLRHDAVSLTLDRIEAALFWSIRMPK